MISPSHIPGVLSQEYLYVLSARYPYVHRKITVDEELPSPTNIGSSLSREEDVED
jgi:hypothetical protein